MVNRIGKTFGILLLAFVGAIIGITLFSEMTGNINTMTGTQTTLNVTKNLTVSVASDLDGQTYISTISVTNGSEEGTPLPTSNFTLASAISSATDLLTVQITLNDDRYDSHNINVSYTYGDDGYIPSAAGRSIALVILIFLALGIIVVVIGFAFREELMRLLERVGR